MSCINITIYKKKKEEKKHTFFVVAVSNHYRPYH